MTGSPSESGSILQDLLHSTEEHAENGLFYLLVSMDRWGQGERQQLERVKVLAARELLDLVHILGGHLGRDLLEQGQHVGGQEDGVKGAAGVAPVLGGKAAVVPHHLHSVPRL